MAAPMLTPDEMSELARLRQRAYGAAADIDADPAALARLDQLEELFHGGAPILIEEEPSPARKAEIIAPAPSALETEEVVTAKPPRRTVAALRSIPVLGWALLAASLAVVLTIVWAVGQVTALRADVELAPLPVTETPPEFARQGLLGYYPMDAELFQQYDDFRTLHVWSAADASGHRCLLISTPGLQRLGTAYTCTPPGLDPSYDFSIWPGLPEDVVGDLPRGSVIRFVLHDERVHVWLREGTWGANAD